MGQSSVLVTGTDRGIGLEFARQYAREKWRVFATCRHPERARDLQRLSDEHPGRVTVHRLDVTSVADIRQVAAEIKDPIDLLINNAGVYGPDEQEFGRTDPENWLQTLRVNALGSLLVMEHFVDHVGRSQKKIICGITSKMGSMADNGSGGCYAYRASKAALNAILKSAAIDLRAKGITVLILHPGWVKTEMGGPQALIAPADSVRDLRRIFENATLKVSGTFYQVDGAVVPW